jgi:hypothetical protein
MIIQLLNDKVNLQSLKIISAVIIFLSALQSFLSAHLTAEADCERSFDEESLKLLCIYV